MKSSLLIFCVAMAVLSGVSGKVKVRPKFQQILANGSAKVVCTFDNPLEACQVRVSWGGNSSWASRDLYPGTAPVPVKDADNVTLMMVSAVGEGHTRKQCGVQLTEVLHGNYLVQCRALNTLGLWSQGFSLLASDAHNPLESTTPTSRFMVAEPGSDVSVLLTTEEAMGACYIKTPSAGEMNLTVYENTPLGSRYLTYGSGLENKQCGYTLKNVTQEDAGVWWWMGARDGNLAWQMTVVAVNDLPYPGQPGLDVLFPYEVRLGNPLFATCVMAPSVPPFNVTWLLDDVPLAPAPKDDMANSQDRLPWRAQITKQTLRHVVVPSDNGKYLKCRVSHVDLPEPHTSNGVRIRVNPVV